MVLPTSSPRRVGLLAGICWGFAGPNVKVPAIPPVWGVGGVFTNDLCYVVYVYYTMELALFCATIHEEITPQKYLSIKYSF